MAALNSSKSSPRKMQKLRTKIKKYTKEEEVKEVISLAFSSGSKVPETINSLLSDCVLESEEPQRRVIFELCIQALNNELLQTMDARDITGKLLFEVDKLQGNTLIILAESLIQGLKEGLHQSLFLFPKLLSIISSKKSIRYQKEDGRTDEICGAVEKKHLLNSLCGCRWEPGCIQRIAHMCQEVPMNADELEFIIEKILRVMKTLKVSELPPLVYQLLVLSGKGHRSMVLEGIKVLFCQLDLDILEDSEEMVEDSQVTKEDRIKELLQTEGTVLLHITSGLKQDPELRKEFSKTLKASQLRLAKDSLTSFFLALTLSMMKMHIFKDTVFSFVKEVVLKSYKEQERRCASRWLQEVYMDAPDVERLFLATVDYSALGGWDHVVEGLFTTGLQLMEYFAPKSSTSVPRGPNYKACSLGSKLLFHTFKVHPMVRQELVSQLINRILTNASTYASHYIQLLAELVQHYHQAAMDSLPKLKEAFSSLSLLPPQPALQLIQAVLPLVVVSVSLRDSLLIVLRKLLFSKKMECRKIAVGAYLFLLQKFTVLDAVEVDSQLSFSNSQSVQVAAEIHANSSSNRSHTLNEGLCLEILGVLRRALTKQCNVRANLYEGLCGVFHVNLKLTEPILDLILGQFERYYESGRDVIPPVKLDLCICIGDSEMTLLEPLDALVRSLQSCVSIYLKWQQGREDEAETEREERGDAKTLEVMESAQAVLVSLVNRMIKSEPEDFELDKSSDFSRGSSVGQKNRQLAGLVMGVQETLMEFTFTSGEFSLTSCEQTLMLYQCYKRLADIVQEKGVTSGRKPSTSGGGSGGGISIKSNLSLNCVVQFLKALFDDNLPNHQTPLTILRDSQFFSKYIMSVALQKIRQIRDSGNSGESLASCGLHKQFRLCGVMARIMFRQIEASATRISASKKDKGKSISALSLEGFSELLHFIITRQHLLQPRPLRTSKSAEPMDLASFLASINSSTATEASLGEKIHYFIRILQRLVVAVLDTSIKEWSMKEVVLMLNIFGLFTDQLEQQSSELSAVFEWVHTLCKEKIVEDVQVTKALVSLMITLNFRLKGSVKTLVKFSQDIHYHLGDIDEDIELEFSPHFAIVSCQTNSTAILAILYSHFDSALVDADWFVARLKTELVVNPVEEIFEKEKNPVRIQKNEFCSSMCSRLVTIVNGLSELVQTLLAAGPNTEGLLKLITKFYSVLGNLTKYCLTAYQHLGCVPPNFKKLVNAVGSDFSQQVYCFITYIQSSQPQPGADAESKNKKDGKGKGRGKGCISRRKAIVRRETRSFPSLIFAIEQFEKLLILLGKKAKEDLMELFKRSLSRDFRIDTKGVESVLNEEGAEEEDETCEGQGEDGGGGSEVENERGDRVDSEDHPPAPKRLKR